MIGQHIRALKAGRWRHAIDCGDETVVHLVEEGAAGACVRRSYRPEFVAGAERVEAVRHAVSSLPPQEVVARAFSLVGNPALAAPFRDCASFAEWCATGSAAPPSGARAAEPRAPRAAARTRASGTGETKRPRAPKAGARRARAAKPRR